MSKYTLVVALLFFALTTPFHTASAHQPQYIGAEAAVEIPDADTSRAYYGELTGQPALFTITSEKEFSLYLNILSPYLPDAKKDFTVRVTNDSGSVIAVLRADAPEWQEWYEEFAGDTYWKGPEFKETVPAGTYTIEVSNPSNQGKYVLAPGEKETFTVAGTPETIRQIYVVKTLFFDKPWYSVFQGVIGKVLLGALVVVLGIAYFVGRLLYRRMHKRF